MASKHKKKKDTWDRYEFYQKAPDSILVQRWVVDKGRDNYLDEWRHFRTVEEAFEYFVPKDYNEIDEKEIEELQKKDRTIIKMVVLPEGRKLSRKTRWRPYEFVLEDRIENLKSKLLKRDVRIAELEKGE